MSLDKPFFSVIIPVYNRELFLSKSIGSVLAQSYSNFELLCIDDGSADNSGKIIKEYCEKDNRIKYFHQENKGRCIARNTGIKNAKADWVCFLDSDDIFFQNHLQVMSELINKFPEYCAFATEQLVNGLPRKYKYKKLNSEYYVLTLKDNMFSNPIQLNQFCYNYPKTKLLFPNENIPVSEDWLFIRQLTIQYPILKTNIVTNEVNDHTGRTMNSVSIAEIVKWNEYTANYFVQNNSLSNSLKRKILSHTYLLCANILLSNKEKKESLNYLVKSFKYPETFFHSLFYKALTKIIFK